MPNTTVPAAGEAMPTHHLKTADLRLLNMKDLDTVQNIFGIIRDVALGLVNQPRCQSKGLLSPAGELIDDLLDHLNNSVSLIVDVAMDSAPSAPNEVEERAWIILRSGANDKDDVAQFTALAASLASDLSSAECQARRGARS